jgi:hypothetical protein
MSFLRAFVRQLLNLPAHILRLIIIFLWSLGWIFRILIGKRWRVFHPQPCPKDIPGHVRRKPDPCLYSQSYLLQQNVPVTWDNPDIWLTELDGTLRSSSDLLPDHPYLVHGRIWDASFDAALGVLVRCTFSNWGINGPTLPVEVDSNGSERVIMVNIPPWQNAVATFRWRTPVTPGHYCLKVICSHPDDRNTANNVGQENVLVLGTTGGTLATLDLPLANPFPTAVGVAIAADTYFIQPAEWQFHLLRQEWTLGLPSGPLPASREHWRLKFQVWLMDNQRQLPHRIRYVYQGRDNLLQRQRDLRGIVPEAWELTLNGSRLPQTIHLEPKEQRTLRLSVRLPHRREHGRREVFNCNAVSDDGAVLGGVTILLAPE